MDASYNKPLLVSMILTLCLLFLALCQTKLNLVNYNKSQKIELRSCFQ